MGMRTWCDLEPLLDVLEENRRLHPEGTCHPHVLSNARVGLATLHPRHLRNCDSGFVSEGFLSEFSTRPLRSDVPADLPQHIRRLGGSHLQQALQAQMFTYRANEMSQESNMLYSLAMATDWNGMTTYTLLTQPFQVETALPWLVVECDGLDRVPTIVEAYDPADSRQVADAERIRSALVDGGNHDGLQLGQLAVSFGGVRLGGRTAADLDIESLVALRAENTWVLLADEASWPQEEDLQAAREAARLGVFDTLWTAPKGGTPGDLALVYFVAPISAACFVARLVEYPFWSDELEVHAREPIDDRQWWTTLTPLVEIEPIAFRSLQEAHGGRLVLRGKTGKRLSGAAVGLLTFRAKDPAHQTEVDRIAAGVQPRGSK